MKIFETLTRLGLWSALLCCLAACPGEMLDIDDGASLGETDGGLPTSDSGGAIWAEAGITLLPDLGPSQLSITDPPRGAILTGDPAVQLQGSATGQLRDFTINGQTVQTAADGSFSHLIQARHGLNLVIAKFEGRGGVVEKQVRSFFYAKEYLQTNPQQPGAAMIKNAALAWVGQPIFDNKNPADSSDFVSVIDRVLAGLDVASLVPNQHRIDDVAGCDKADIEINNIQYAPPKTAIDVKAGALLLTVRIDNFQAKVKADLDGDWYNPACSVGVSGKVKASSIVATANVVLSVQGGVLKAEATQTTAQIQNFDIDIGGIWGFLTNWLVNTFEGDLKDKLEERLKEELDEQLGPLFSKGLGSLAIDEQITLNPFFGEGAPVVLDLVSRAGALILKEGGVRYALDGTAVSTPRIQQPSRGSIARGSCSAAEAPPFTFRETAQSPLQVAVSDDLLNQALYSLHQGGLLAFGVTQQDYDEDLQLMGISGLEGSVDALLPPVVNTCVGQPILQLGDLRLRVKFQMTGGPVDMELHFAAEAPVEMSVRQNAEGQRLRFAIKEVSRLEVDSKNLANGAATIYDGMKRLLESMVPELLMRLQDQSVSVKIPEIALSELHESMPATARLQLKLDKVEQRDGYTVVVGGIQTSP